MNITICRWTLETFKLGYSRDIRDSDLYAPLPEHTSNILGKTTYQNLYLLISNGYKINETCNSLFSGSAHLRLTILIIRCIVLVLSWIYHKFQIDPT